MKVSKQPKEFMLTRLVWMKENLPHLTLEKYQDGTLKQSLMQQIQNAVELEQYLEKQNLPEQEIEEIILDSLAPSEAMSETLDKKPVISEKKFNEILTAVT